jgi:hypothetical protein
METVRPRAVRRGREDTPASGFNFDAVWTSFFVSQAASDDRVTR